MLERQMTGTYLTFIAKAPDFPKALCDGIADPDIFFPVSKEEQEKTFLQVNAICRACPHQVECAVYAINYEMEYGIWGGLSPEERRLFWDNRKISMKERKGRNCRDSLRQGMSIQALAQRWRTTPDKVQEWIDLYERWEVSEAEIANYLSVN